MVYFIGFTLSGVFVPRLQDNFGRRAVFLIGRLITIFCFIIIVAMP